MYYDVINLYKIDQVDWISNHIEDEKYETPKDIGKQEYSVLSTVLDANETIENGDLTEDVTEMERSKILEARCFWRKL